MRLLIDTHLLLRAAAGERLSSRTAALLDDEDNDLFFSAVTIWEIGIKSSLGRGNFAVDAALFRRELLDNAYAELPITGIHACVAGRLPDLHHDPFDRMLIAQAQTEGMTLLTADRLILRYPGPIEAA